MTLIEIIEKTVERKACDGASHIAGRVRNIARAVLEVLHNEKKSECTLNDYAHVDLGDDVRAISEIREFTEYCIDKIK